jgi:RimJ/RimL family protein N-acetyltransferase
MTNTATNAGVSTDRLDLVPMSLELMEALERGDMESAQRLVGYRISADWPQVMGSVLRFRIPLARSRPDAVPLLLLAMVLRAEPEVVVGRLGFHGPVDDDGMLEIGYEVFPAYRRQGYAREAVSGMFRSAQRDPAVLRFRASVRPDNAPSRNLVTSLGFTEVGSQWDDEDGEETLFECAAGRFAGNGSALR